MAALSNSHLEWPNPAEKALDRQHDETDRMVAAGRLLGGVAHDFANVLTLIAGYSELLLNRVGKTMRCGRNWRRSARPRLMGRVSRRSF